MWVYTPIYLPALCLETSVGKQRAVSSKFTSFTGGIRAGNSTSGAAVLWCQEVRHPERHTEMM